VNLKSLFKLFVIASLSIGVITAPMRPVLAQATVTPRCTNAPSGQVMPLGNLTGWQQVFADDFSGTALNTTRWGAYQGQPSGDPNGWWDASHVVVNNCKVTLRGYYDSAVKPGIFVTGGIGMKEIITQPYGKYEVRMRIDKGNGVSAIALLWPQAAVWPPEIDFYEDPGGDRTTASAFFHCGTNGNNSCILENKLLNYDLSQWHTVGVEWTPGTLKYTIDATVWATLSDSRVPTIPMFLAIQLQALVCSAHNTCLDGTTPANVNLDIDWVVIYQPGTTTIPDTIGAYKNGVFYLRNSNTTGGADFTATFGGDVSDLPVVGDWNADGVDSIGVYRSSTGVFYLSDSNTKPVINYALVFGNPNDTPFAGRWTADMLGSGIGVYRNSNGILYERKALTTGAHDFYAVFGNAGDKAVAGDWDGNGYDSIGIYRSSAQRWYLSNNSQPSGPTFGNLDFVWNIGTGLPVVGDWDGNGTSTPGYLATDGKVVLHSANASAGTDTVFYFGPAGSKPLAGKWGTVSAAAPQTVLVYPAAQTANLVLPDVSTAD
jgi:hypothetical protein